VVVVAGFFQTLASNRSWPRSLEGGVDRWLVTDAWEEGGVESSSRSAALRFLEGVDGADGGGVGRV
jgi:hypothetical protein